MRVSQSVFGFALVAISLALSSPVAAEVANGEGDSVENEEPRWREKPLLSTVGIPPTQMDLGNEADLFTTDEEKREQKSKEWKLEAKAFIRGSASASYGPRHDGTPGSQLHAMPRIPGRSSGDWDHIGVIPNPSAKAYFSAGTPNVSANVILGGQPPLDQGYENLSEMGWFLDAYVTLRFPRMFAEYGGVTMRTGSFSHRYGNAGKKTTGYYRNLLYGKIHTTGTVVTADFDLTKHWEFLAEYGVGAKLDVVPFITGDDRPNADFLQGQGDSPRGSNFVQHGHLGLRHDYWLRLGAHWITSWSPNDRTFDTRQRSKEARLTVSGVEVNIDLPTGSGYLGYMHMDASRIVPLSNGLQVLHASRGTDVIKNYFAPKERDPNDPAVVARGSNQATNDSGTVHTLLYQYILSFGKVFRSWPHLDLATFAMYSNVRSPVGTDNTTINNANMIEFTDEHLRYDRLKYGAELLYTPIPWLKLALRGDRVQSDMSRPEISYSAVTPRIFLSSGPGSKERIVVSYSYFFYGDGVYPGSPYRELIVNPDPHFFGISGVMSL